MPLKGHLRKLLFGSEKEAERAPGKHASKALHRAAASLLVEAAILDGDFDEAERRRILNLCEKRFSLTPEDATALVEAAEAEQADSIDSYIFTREIRAHFDAAERVEMIDMLWDVVFADGAVHDYEADLMRRITGLLYVSDRENGEARKRALQRAGLPDA